MPSKTDGDDVPSKSSEDDVLIKSGEDDVKIAEITCQVTEATKMTC